MLFAILWCELVVPSISASFLVSLSRAKCCHVEVERTWFIIYATRDGVHESQMV